MKTHCTPPAATIAAWPTTRILFLLAGTVTLVSALLAATITPWFLLLTGFVGANQLLFVAVGACPVSLIIDAIRPANSTSAPEQRSPDATRR